MAETSQSMAIKIEKFMTKKAVVWNVVLFVLIKFALSYSGVQLASIIEHVLPFGSRDVIEKTNEARAAEGLSPLVPNHKLDLAANEKLQDMIDKGYFAHISPEGTTPWFWIKKTAYQYIYAGENLAIGFTDAEETVNAWLNSPTHRANLLNSNYREIGVAVGTVENVQGYSGTLIVQMFGRPVVQTAFADTAPTVTPASNQNVGAANTGTNPTASPVEQPATAGTGNTVPELVSNNASLERTVPEEEPVALQYISTDDAIAPVSEPTELTYKNGAFGINNIADSANRWFTVYALLLAAASVIFVAFADRSRKYAAGAAFNVALLIAAIAVPVIQAVGKSAIF